MLRRHRRIDQPECQLCGRADDLDQLLRIAEARNLDQDAVDALALDRGLDQAQGVDPPLDDLDGLVDDLAGALDQRRLGHRQPDQPAADVFDVQRPRSSGAEKSAERLRQVAQLRQALLQIAIVLASVAIITGGTVLLVLSSLLASLGTVSMLNGFLLFFAGSF